jgi:hypothetical protein
VDLESLRRRFGLLSKYRESSDRLQRGKIIAGSLCLVPGHELAKAAAERAEQERQAELAQTGNMLNQQIQGSSIERAAEAGSNRKQQRSDQLLTRVRGKSGKRAQRVVVSGVVLRSLSKDVIALHRANFVHVVLGLPAVWGLHLPDEEGGQMQLMPRASTPKHRTQNCCDETAGERDAQAAGASTTAEEASVRAVVAPPSVII